jgi:peptidoglycan-N-acetylglucosamine deacetylase
MKISLTFDIEEDLHSKTYFGIKKGIPTLLKILNKKDIKATFFIQANILKKFPQIFLKLKKQGHEIALHGLEHERFDDLILEEKQNKIKKAVEIYKKIFKINPKGFRAPQHSIDYKTLKELKRSKFLYDASYTPHNIIQGLFFPKKILHFLNGFFGPRRIYLLENSFYEIPTSSFFIPFVSLTLRVFSWRILKKYLKILEKTNDNLIFYAHSWDLIELKKSKIDKKFPHNKFLDNLKKIISYYPKMKFVRMEELVK